MSSAFTPPSPFLPAIRPPATPSPEAWCFAFVQRDLLLPDGLPLPAPLEAAAAAALLDGGATRHYLGALSATDCWAVLLPEAPPGWQPTPLRAAMMALPPALSALAGRAAQVLEWDRSHRHCGVCGTPTVLTPGERARTCPACGHASYPRLSPAMMALVWRPGELTRRACTARWPAAPPRCWNGTAAIATAASAARPRC